MKQRFGDETEDPDGDSDVAIGRRSLSRLAQRKRKKRRIQLIILLGTIITVSFLIFACVWWPGFRERIYRPFKWIGERVSSLWSSHEKPPRPVDEILFINPINGQEHEGKWINTLSVIKDNQGVVHALLYISYDREEGSTSFFWIPEGIKGKSSEGKDISLAEAIRASGGKLTTLRNLVESMVGEKIHYIVLIDLMDLPEIYERVGAPGMIVEAKTEVYNPFTGEKEKMYEGQNLRDKSSVLSYLLAEGEPGKYKARVDRGSRYLLEMLKKFAEKEETEIKGALEDIAPMISLTPAPGEDSEKARYLGAMVYAWGYQASEGINCLSVPEIEILNGCGIPGAGLRVKERFEAKGFEVSEAGKNAKVIQDGREVNDFSHKKSMIIIHSQDKLIQAYARYLAVIFSIPEVEYAEGEPGKIKVIVGSDLAQP